MNKRMSKMTAVALGTAGSLTGVAGPALGQSVPASANKEAVVRVVTRWDAGGCNQNTVDAWDNMVKKWYDEITDTGNTPWGHAGKAWVRDGFYHNGNIVDSDFTDDDLVDWGNDDGADRLDEPDAIMIALHGIDPNNDSWYGAVRVDEPGTGNCNATMENMKLGNGDLEFLHFSSCESMNQESWLQWADVYYGLHQIDGWHGLMWISTSYNGRYRRFADDAFNISIAESWIDNHYDNAWEAWQEHDHCPVAHGVGTSQSSASARLGNEEYDWVYSDLSHGSIGYVMVFAIVGCDPDSEGPITN